MGLAVSTVDVQLMNDNDFDGEPFHDGADHRVVFEPGRMLLFSRCPRRLLKVDDGHPLTTNGWK